MSAIHAVGYSLGGNALLKYLGEQGADCPLTSAVAVCPPLVLEEGARQLDRGLARGYQRYLLSLMRGQHNAKRERYPQLGLHHAGPELDNFWRFGRCDHSAAARVRWRARLLSPLRSAPVPCHRVEVPCHLICAEDDPFFTTAILPEADELGARMTLERSSHGGHVGFLEGAVPGRPRYWLDERVADMVVETTRLVEPDPLASSQRSHRNGTGTGWPDRPRSTSPARRATPAACTAAPGRYRHVRPPRQRPATPVGRARREASRRSASADRRTPRRPAAHG